jgi:hypothetical protein
MSSDTIDSWFSAPRLWLGESTDEFDNLRAELVRAIRPECFVEELYVYDMAVLTFEIRRLRRMKTDMIIRARPKALLSIFKECLVSSDYFTLRRLPITGLEIKAKSLCRAWLENGTDKKEAEDLLQAFQFDERVIDLEAYRMVFSEMQDLDKLLASAEARFSKAIRNISDYRKSFALTIESSVNQILASYDTPRLQPASDTAEA